MVSIARSFGVTALAGVLSLAASAQSVITSPEPCLSLVFQTDGGTPSLGTGTISLMPVARGVGYSSEMEVSAVFPGATTVATAQTIYNRLVLGTTIGAGSAVQIGLHSFARNPIVGDVTPVLVYVSLFNYQDNGPSLAPIGTPIVTNVPLAIKPRSDGLMGDTLFYTAPFGLPTALTSGADYVIAVAPSAVAGGPAPANFGVAFTSPVMAAAPFREVWYARNNSAATGGPAIKTTDFALAYRLHSGAPQITGNVALEQYLGPAGISATMEFRTPGTTNVLFTKPVTLDGSGNYSIACVTNGTYDIALKFANWLREVKPSIVIAGPAVLNWAPKNGDADGDNDVDISDLNKVLVKFGSVGSGSGDLNHDGQVALGDLNIVLLNFGLSGAP